LSEKIEYFTKKFPVSKKRGRSCFGVDTDIAVVVIDEVKQYWKALGLIRGPELSNSFVINYLQLLGCSRNGGKSKAELGKLACTTSHSTQSKNFLML